MEVVKTGNPIDYTHARVRAFVYKRTGDYEPEPEYVQEMLFSNQFTDEELIADIALRSGMIWPFETFKPDIRKITIDYLED